MERVIEYLRVSTTTQDEQRQHEQIEKYCESHNMVIVDTIKEEKQSGSIANRDGVIKLLGLTKKDCDRVIITETSRLSREDNYLTLANNVTNLLAVNIDVLFLSNKKELKGGRYLTLEECISLIFEAKANADERQKIKERSLSGKESKVKQGCYIGGYVAYGYKVVPNPKRKENNKEYGKTIFQIEESKRKTIELIFDSIGNKGLTLIRTSDYINSLGLYKDGEKWTASNIGDIVYNTFYVGDFKGEQNNVPAIVDRDLYNKTRLKLKSNRLFEDSSPVNHNPLKGLAKCACGSSLCIKKNKRGKFYRCLKKLHPKNYLDSPCYNFGIDTEFLNRIVWGVTKSFLIVDNFKERTEKQKNSILLNIEVKESNRQNYTNKLATIERRIENAKNAIFDNENRELTPFLTSELSKLLTEQKDTKAKIESLYNEVVLLNDTLKNFNIEKDNSLIESTTQEERKEIFKKYIEKVTYYSVNTFKGFVVVKFKTAIEFIIFTKVGKRIREAYQLPQSFSFNPETRKVITSLAEFDKENTFSIPSIATKELNYSELEKTFNMEEFKMDSDYQNNIEEQYQTEYNIKLADLKN